MNNEILIKLKEKISDELLSFNDQLAGLSQFNLDKISDNVQSFLNIYKSTQKIDFNLLAKFFDELPANNISSLEEYQKISNYLTYLEANNINHMYDYDIRYCQASLNKLIEEINKLSATIFANIRKYEFELRNLQNNIATYQKIDFIISEYINNQFLSNEQFNELCDFIRNNNTILTNKETITLIAQVTKDNSETMQKRIELEEKKRKRIQEQKEKQRTSKIEKKKAEQKSMMNSQENSKNLESLSYQEIVESGQTKQNNYTFSNESQRNLYNKAKEIADNGNYISSNVNVAASMLPKEISWKEREVVYDTLTINLDKLALISYDLRTIILPILEESLKNNTQVDNIFYLIDKIIIYYNEILNSKKERHQPSIDYTICLKTFEMNNELDFCYQVDNLLEKCLELRNSNPQLFYSTNIQMLVKDLKEKKNDYEQCVLECYNDGLEKNKELLDLLYQDLIQAHNALNKLYENSIYSTPTEKEELINLGKNLYNNNSPTENILLFINDDGSVSSIIEDDIENDKSLGDWTYSPVLSCLRITINNPLIAEGNSKSKSDSYEEKFLKTYMVKSFHAGHARVFYSRFHSTLGQLFGCKDPHIIFIHAVGYGNTDGKRGGKKDEANQDAIRRCRADQKNIDYYCKLLQTDWNSVPPEKKPELETEIINYLNRQYLKLGHFIKVTEEKQKLAEVGKGAR